MPNNLGFADSINYACQYDFRKFEISSNFFLDTFTAGNFLCRYVVVANKIES
jgi:hypothetical protein